MRFFYITLKIVLSCLVLKVQCSRILLLFPGSSPSHSFLGKALGKGLAKVGHDVTIVTPYKDAKPFNHEKYREIFLDGIVERRQKLNINLFEVEKSSTMLVPTVLNQMGYHMVNNTLSHPKIQQLLASNEKFDAVIIEQFMNDALKVFAYHFEAPLIVFTLSGSTSWINHLVGNPAPLSYIPEITTGFSGKMSLMERTQNVVCHMLSELNRIFIHYPSQEKLLKHFFPNAPDFEKLVYNVSLVLLNYHVSVAPAVPLVPNVIPIGGFHVNPPETLPEDLQIFLNSAKEGAIYFSMGSNLQTKDLPQNKVKNLLNVFKKLKQKILWKWEGKDLPGIPPNVMIRSWFPQQDVLGHKNIKLFITHGGFLSAIETIFHGVPVLSIPVYGDQKMNSAQISLQGYGLTLDISDLDDENIILSTLNKLLTNQSYTEVAQQRSKIMKDQPVKPMDSAIFWIEYVIRHNGATHLRVAGASLPFYQYLLLDVFGFILFIIVSFSAIIYYILKMLCKNKIVKTVKRKVN